MVFYKLEQKVKISIMKFKLYLHRFIKYSKQKYTNISLLFNNDEKYFNKININFIDDETIIVYCKTSDITRRKAKKIFNKFSQNLF